MTEDPLQDSLTKLRQGLEVLLSPYDFLGISEPQGPLSAEHLAALLDARTRFGVDETHLQPNLNAAQRFAERLCGPNRRGSLEDRVLELLATVDQLIVKALDTGIQDRRIVRTADFKDIKGMEIPNGTVNARGEPCGLLLYGGVTHSLPQDHWLKTVLPEDDFYQWSGSGTNTPSLILGRAQAAFGGSGPPRKWYATAEATRLTLFYRNQQRLKDQEAAEQLRREQRQKDAEFWNSPLGEHIRKEEAIRRLQAQGRIPAAPEPAQPAVRIGR